MDAFYVCQCQHPSHYWNEAPTPGGNPGHPANQAFPVERVSVVLTPKGSRAFCDECLADCHAADQAFAVNLLDGASVRTALAGAGPSEVHVIPPRAGQMEEWCRDARPGPLPVGGTIYCTLRKGHDGALHVNHAGDRAVAVWHK